MTDYTVIPWPGGVIGRAAEVLATSVNADPPYSLHRSQAQALADAGLLITEDGLSPVLLGKVLRFVVEGHDILELGSGGFTVGEIDVLRYAALRRSHAVEG